MAARFSLGVLFSTSLFLWLYIRATTRDIKQSVVDFVLLLMQIRLRFVPNLLGNDSIVLGLTEGKPLPSTKYLALAALFSLTKPQVRKRFAQGVHVAKDLRQAMQALPLFYASVAYGTEITQVKANGVKAFWVRAAGVRRDAPVLLELHGGGYAAGSAEDQLGYLSRWSRSLNVRALAVDYRLTPEHPFPACVEDALAAYQWLLDEGVYPKSIWVSGASAGGGLTLLLLQAIEKAGLPQPACAVPISCFADLTCSGASFEANKTSDLMLEVDNFEYMTNWALGLKDKNNKVLRTKPLMESDDPRCSSLFGNFEGMCPLFLMVGAGEILVDDSQRIARRAKSSGVKVELEIADHMIHMYPLFADRFPEADEAVARVKTFIDKHLERPLYSGL